MPPNRKTDLRSSDVPTLNVSQLKLTVSGVAATRTEATPSAAANYWDWPLDPVIQQMQSDESTRRLFSVEHMEANLVAESQRLQSSQSRMIVAEPSEATPVNYWD
jgi:hypothetical protein